MNHILELALAVERAVDPAAANRQAMEGEIADLSARASFLVIPPSSDISRPEPALDEAFGILRALQQTEHDCKDFGLPQLAQRARELSLHYKSKWLEDLS